MSAHGSAALTSPARERERATTDAESLNIAKSSVWSLEVASNDGGDWRATG
jgi:hypothetical protein